MPPRTRRLQQSSAHEKNYGRLEAWFALKPARSTHDQYGLMPRRPLSIANPSRLLRSVLLRQILPKRITRKTGRVWKMMMTRTRKNPLPSQVLLPHHRLLTSNEEEVKNHSCLLPRLPNGNVPIPLPNQAQYPHLRLLPNTFLHPHRQQRWKRK